MKKKNRFFNNILLGTVSASIAFGCFGISVPAAEEKPNAEFKLTSVDFDSEKSKL